MTAPVDLDAIERDANVSDVDAVTVRAIISRCRAAESDVEKWRVRYEGEHGERVAAEAEVARMRERLEMAGSFYPPMTDRGWRSIAKNGEHGWILKEGFSVVGVYVDLDDAFAALAKVRP